MHPETAETTIEDLVDLTLLECGRRAEALGVRIGLNLVLSGRCRHHIAGLPGSRCTGIERFPHLDKGRSMAGRHVLVEKQ